jgi:CheY-like chemotaxis protein
MRAVQPKPQAGIGFEEFVRVSRRAAWRGGPFAPMLAALLGPDILFMGELLIGLLAAAVLGLLAGGRVWRRRADARRAEAEREAQRQAAEQAERERFAAAEAQSLAERHAEQQRQAAERVEAEQRAAAERAERTRAVAAEREAQRQAELQAEQQRQAAEQAERERIAAAEAQRRAAEQAEAQRLAEWRVEQQRLAAERAEAERRAAAEQAERERFALAEVEREAQLAAERAAPCPRPAAKSAAQTLVLVADDSKVVRIKTGRLLAQHQYQVSYASDGLDAVQQMQANPPDVVITDVEMPGMDGFELTRHIRGNPQTAQLPVIMITAADDRHREQADSAGVSVLLGKPYPEDALIAHIRLAMGQDAAETSLA